MKTKYYRKSEGEHGFNFSFLACDGEITKFINEKGKSFAISELPTSRWLNGFPKLEEVPASEIVLMFGFLP